MIFSKSRLKNQAKLRNIMFSLDFWAEILKNLLKIMLEIEIFISEEFSEFFQVIVRTFSGRNRRIDFGILVSEFFEILIIYSEPETKYHDLPVKSRQKPCSMMGFHER